MDGDSYTVTFTANDGFAGRGSVTVGTGYTDAAANVGIGGSDSVNIDRVTPAPPAPVNLTWARQFGGFGNSYEAAFAAATDGSVYVAASTLGTLAGQTSAGNQDAVVRKYDASGNVLWTSQFGTADDDVAYSIAVDATGVYVTGFTRGAFT